MAEELISRQEGTGHLPAARGELWGMSRALAAVGVVCSWGVGLASVQGLSVPHSS